MLPRETSSTSGIPPSKMEHFYSLRFVTRRVDTSSNKIMPMHRRDAICSIGALLSGIFATTGCIGLDGEPQNARPSMRVTDLSSEIQHEKMVATSSVVQPEITSEKQGQIRLGMKWIGADPIRVSSGMVFPITPGTMSTRPQGLVLGNEGSGFSRRDDQTWIIDGDSIAVPLGERLTPFSPNEKVTSTYGIWGNPKYLERIQPNEYVFQVPLSFYEDRMGDGIANDEQPEYEAVSYSVKISISGEEA